MGGPAQQLAPRRGAVRGSLYAFAPVSPDSASAPSLSVVVVTFRHGDELRAPLAALSAQLREGDELIVVDNASGDRTPDVALEAAPQARLIRNEENVGFPAACNRGAAEASGDLLVFLNP